MKNKIDLIFSDLKNEAITEKQTHQQILNLFAVMSRFSQESKNSKRVKSLFVTYFDGCYGVDAEPNTFNTFAMGACKLEYKDKENELIVHLRRPGLLIGKGGRTIDALAKQLKCKIGIVVANLQKLGITVENKTEKIWKQM